MTRVRIAASHGEQAVNENSQQSPCYLQASAVISRHVVLKSIGTTLFISLFFGAYFYLLKQPVYPPTVMPITLLDRLIGFQPLALPMYLSLWVYVSLPPALLATRRELYGYGLAMAGTCLAGLIVFYFWPTVVPAANIDWAQYPDVAFLKESHVGILSPVDIGCGYYRGPEVEDDQPCKARPGHGQPIAIQLAPRRQ